METVNAKTAVTLVCLWLILIAVSVPLCLGMIKMNSAYVLYPSPIRGALG